LKFRNLIWLIVFFFFSKKCFGQFSETQQKKIAELTQTIKEAKHDTLLAKSYYELSEILYVVKLDTIISLCNKSIDIIENNLNKNISKKEIISFLTTKANCFNNIGYVYKSHGDIPKALEYYHNAIIINEGLNNKSGKADLINNIAVIYESQHDIDKAIEYYEQSLLIYKEVKNKKGIATTLNNLGIINRSFQKNTEKALAYYQESLEIRKEINDLYGVSNSLNNIGFVYQTLNDISKALEFYQESLRIRQELNYKLGIARSLTNIGNLYLLEDKIELAKEYGEKSLSICLEGGFTEDIGNTSLLLKNIYQKENKPKKELEMFELHVKMKDSIDNRKNKTAVYKQQLQYEYDKQKAIDKKETEKQLAIAEEKKEKQKVITIFISFCLALLLTFAIVFYKRWKLTQQQKRIIEGQNKALSEKNKEKEYMMMEIHHRVKNNLQIVNSLLRFQSREINDPKILSMFEDVQNRVLSMSLVHEQMYRSDNLMELEIDNHLSTLIKELIKDYNIDTKIELKCDIEKIQIGIKTLIPLGLIINEIVSNSMKHGFKERKKGVISISLKQLGDKQLELIIGDDGLGSEHDLDIDNQSSLGIELIQVFTEQLDGTIEKLPPPGTTYKVLFLIQD
jgi:two-component sensor histidine kinase